MLLNYIWVAFFLIGFLVAVIKLIFFNDTEIFPQMMQITFDSAKTGFEISLGLTGVMTLWLGLMRIGEKGGIVPILSKLVGPFFSRLFPELPKNHPAIGSIIMNFSANILGLENASTPLGLKAMKELQDANPDKETASNAQIMFLVLNTSGLTIIPLAIIADRVSMGSANPTSIFIPALMATFVSTMVGLTYLAFKQKINLLEPVMLAYLLALMAIVGSAAYYFSTLTPDALQKQSNLFAAIIILTIIITFLLLGVWKRLPLYETFVEGARDGFETSVKIIPFLVGMIVAIGVFRVSGAFQYLTEAVAWALRLLSVNTDFVEALPVAFLKPLSGGISRAMMIDISKANGGPDTFLGNMASLFRGCTDTTFYILAVYFGSVNIRKTRYAVTAGLIADSAGIIAAIFIGYMFFR